jgi:hypothetical protein
LANLDVPLSALYALARVPKEIRDEVIAEVEERSGRGEKPKVATIHERRCQTKSPQCVSPW